MIGVGLSIPELAVIAGAGAGEAGLVLDNFISHIVMSGQSLAVGTSGSPALTTSQPYDNVMFTGGLKASISAASVAGFVDLVEASLETGHAALVNGVIDLIEDEDGQAYTDHSLDFLGTNCGVGNTAVAQLGPGTTAYAAYLADIAAAKTVADGLGRTTRVEAIIYRQGERDQLPTAFPAPPTPSAWKRYVRALLQLKENDAYRANPNEAVPLLMIIYQLASHSDPAVGGTGGSLPTIAWAIEELALDDDVPIYLSNPLYHLAHADDVHLTNASYKKLGAAEGYALKRALIDGAPLSCFSPSETARSGAEITLTFPIEAARQLVLDTTLVSNPGSYGFEVDDDTATPMTISSVTLVGTNQVRITCSASVPAGATVYYARTPTTSGTTGPTTGPRGCLRDNTGDAYTVNISSVDTPVHRWCAIFKRVLA